MGDSLVTKSITHAWRVALSEERLPLAGAFVVLTLALLPLAGPSNYLLHILVLVFVYVSLGQGLNVVVGFAGLLDLGYVAFYAIGAYTYALLSLNAGVSFLPALAAGATLAALFGVILGWPTIRTRGDYLALVTLGFGEIIRLVLRNWVAVTNGPKGLMGLPAPRVLGVSLNTPGYYYYLGLLLGTAALALAWRVKYSAVGQQLAAIRDDEDAATSVGINPVRWKLYAFATGAFVAGAAGVFFASWQTFVSPESFTLGESILILSIVVLGGMGRLWPTVAAAAFLVLLPEVLRGLETYRILVLGIFFVIVVIIQERLRLRRVRLANAPRRVASSIAHAQDERTRTRPAAETAEGVGDVLLSLSHVAKSFGGISALKDVSLEVRRGEILGLIGANGAGKTTLFNCIAGALRPDSGEINLLKDGAVLPLHKLPAYKTARTGLVRTFQQPRLFSSLTAGLNVELGTRCRNVPKLWEPFYPRKGAGRGEEVAHALGLTGAPPPETAVDGMSFVDQKLTELARALATRPEVILVDEPASGMEIAARASLSRLLRRASREEGITVVVVEHDLSFLSSTCDRLVVLDRGRVAADGPPSDEHVTETIRQTYHTTWGQDANT
jgi:branched-chain amino acid transport system permease protein